MAKKVFKTEVSQLLNLIIHSLYSHKEIFLRELISNSSDALDKLKYLTITDDNFKKLKYDPKITIKLDEAENKLIISDNGIGMDENDLNDNLGTIARSGTKNFLANLSGDAAKDSNLIGQFGVGFYSAFMVADNIEVVSKKAGSDVAYKWISDGKEKYEIEQVTKDEQGTDIYLFLNDEGKEFLSKWRAEELIKKYSDHIVFPIYLDFEDSKYEGEGENRKEIKERKIEQVNSASALWKKSKKDLKPEEYNEFYKTIAHDTEDPLFYMHTKAEGTLEYTTLFYIPAVAPYDMFYADYKPGVKLYVKRIYITDDEKELLPTYLRFVKGIIDSEDLPLNVSREILQHNQVLAKIRQASVKKILEEFKTVAINDSAKYDKFISLYNRPLKEGLYSDYANRDLLLDIIRFKSTEVEGWTSLESYKERMKTDQKAIYYLTGKEKNNPLIEGYKKKGYEVLICEDEIDDMVIPSIGTYKETPLKAVNRTGSADDIKTEEDKKQEESAKPIVDKIKDILGDKVKSVVASVALSDSPACIVADENDPTAYMQQMMKMFGQKDMPEIKPVLQVNPTHPILEKFDSLDADLQTKIANILFDQALLIEGVPIKDMTTFVKTLNEITKLALK